MNPTRPILTRFFSSFHFSVIHLVITIFFVAFLRASAEARALMCVCKQIRQILPHAYHCHVLGQDGHATTTQIDQKRFILIYILCPSFFEMMGFFIIQCVSPFL